MTSSQPMDLGAFVHPALFYHSTQEYLDCLIPFITEGLRAEQKILVAVPGPNLAILRDALGDTAAGVTIADMSEAGRNPGRILGSVLSRFADDHAPQPVRMIGEPIWAGRSDAEYPACVQHEALINNAFAGRELTVLCPYDATTLDPAVIADARITHPELWQEGAKEVSLAFAPNTVREHYNQPLPGSAQAATYTVRELADLSGARAFAAAYARWFGLSPNAVSTLQLIANELAASVEHTHGSCRLAFWHHDGHLICEARDRGCLDDPLTGRRPYSDESPRGRGLFVVNAVADLVRTHTTSEETTVRAYLRLEEAA